MVSLLSAIVVLGVLIFVHELGHFIFAKLFGVGVEKFSLGFGPKLVGRKVGETEYLLSAFPLGGYVKMVGEGDDVELSEAERLRSFAEKPPLQRIVIVAAGPLFNILFAYLIFVVVSMIGIPFETARVGEVIKGKPAALAGLMTNDLVTAVNGRPVDSFEAMTKEILASKGKSIDLQVRRGKEGLAFTIVPESLTEKNLLGETVTRPVIGIRSAGEKFIQHFGPGEAFIEGGRQTWNVVRFTFIVLVKMIQRVIPADTIGGPIMIAVTAGQQAAAGGTSFLAFMALLSINLGVLNILPVPILDGGHLFFYTWELVFRRPVSPKTREISQKIGLFILLSLMLLAMYNDIVRYLIKQG